ncbi:hypothetical protein PPTG_14895 [Phytophthora nicotianae INRA-310]|uniref:Uncharacterized protein n=1 Tax=Phytophthora nicotianae (strain INRA-310) TaxID=761204 RepID=W2PT97_PHYN3|nr:hypothetical protein PPTG_14895 [Phytophthora nicotianae INRA-310]ETN04183.1 hypothetical protein PPTG_14895 [Phytophthora nicotianae INRA-310]
MSAIAGIVMWVVTTPLRNVSWAFLDNVVDNGRAVYFFVYTCGDRYLDAARNANALSLPPLEYACALISLAFLIPIAVLQDYEVQFGITGRLCLRWCEAFHHSCCLFVPDAVQLLWMSTCKYARATGEATVAVIERTGDFLMGIYLAVSLMLSLLVYLPRLVYESFVWESCYWSVTVQVVGCYSHGLRYYWTCRPRQREERERASLERLRGTPKKGTPKEVQDGDAKPYGTPTGGVPEVVAGETLEGGLAIFADCIQKVCLKQGQRATSSKTGQEEQTSAFHV